MVCVTVETCVQQDQIRHILSRHAKQSLCTFYFDQDVPGPIGGAFWHLCAGHKIVNTSRHAFILPSLSDLPPNDTRMRCKCICCFTHGAKIVSVLGWDRNDPCAAAPGVRWGPISCKLCFALLLWWTWMSFKLIFKKKVLKRGNYF